MSHTTEVIAGNSTPDQLTTPDLSMLAPPDVERWSRQYLGIYGPCQWLNNHVPIHYLLTSVTVLDLHREIKLMEDIPGIEKWGFEALFQRLINRERVTKEIVRGYLRNDDKIKFLPPITIALLPAAHNVPARSYSSPILKGSDDRSGSVWCLDGLEIQLPFQPPEAQNILHGQPARFKWSHQHFIAVAIDGQHRISALREFVGEHDQDAASKDIPATFILFDSQPILGRDVLQATREVFVDVNSTPKTVDESRLILLNDRDVCSETTRRLIGPAFTDDGSLRTHTFVNIAEDLELQILDSLPQELVNVTAGKQTADVTKLAPWQFTSAFLLYRVIRDFFIQNDFRRFEELTATTTFTAEVALEDPDRAAKLEIVERRAELNVEPEEENGRYISSAEVFSFSPNATRILAQRLLGQWRSLLLGVFTRFTPYHNLILQFQQLEASLPNDSDREDFRQILIAEGNRMTLGAEAGSDSGPYAFGSSSWEKIHSVDPVRASSLREKIRLLCRPDHWQENDISWLSVFQRGILFEPLQIRRALSLHETDDSREEFSDRVISLLNRLYSFGWFERSKVYENELVWGGIILKFNPEGAATVEPGDPAARRLGYLVRLLLLAKFGESWCQEWETRLGVSRAFNKTREAYEKYFQAKNPSLGSDEIKEKALTHLRGILQTAATEMQILSVSEENEGEVTDVTDLRRNVVSSPDSDSL